MQNQVERETLLVEQDELLAVADLSGGHRQQLAARCRARAQQHVGVRGAGRIRRQAGFQIVHEVSTALASKEPPMRGFDQTAKRRHAELGGVMKVRDSRNGLIICIQRGQEVEKIITVAPLPRTLFGWRGPPR